MNSPVPPTGSDRPRAEDPELIRTLREAGPGRRVFDRFCLEREIGEGGMGVVWLALDEWLDRRPVALKFLARIISADTEALADLRREIRHGLDISHPGIVRVYDLHESKSEHLAAITMEFVEGKTLSELKIAQHDRCFDPPEILAWVRQLCEILDYLHQDAGVVHRDLKPRNLMLTPRGRLKLADFGIAAAISESHSRLTQLSRGPTSGTPCYMSPQQIKGRAARPSDDIYALGATLFEMLTGRPPFFRGPAAAILAQAEYDPAPTIAERRTEFGIRDRPSVPPEWEATIAACLAKAPEARPLSAQEVFAQLAAAVPVSSAGASPAMNRLGTENGNKGDPTLRGAETKDEVTLEADASASVPSSPASEEKPAIVTSGASTTAKTLAEALPSTRPKLIGAIVLLIATLVAIGIWQWSANTKQPGKIGAPSPKPQPIVEQPADLLQKAEASLARNDSATAFALCQKAADAGDSTAQFELARFYFQGIGTPRNPEKAVSLYQSLAATGDPAAQTQLGWLYATGQSVAKDPETAANYYRQASANGNPVAQNNLGLMLANGEGAPKDPSKAAELYRTALGNGEARAANNLGVMYRTGSGVEKNEQSALEYFRQGADLGDPAAQVNLAAMYIDGRVVSQNYEKAVTLLRSASAAGDSTASFDLGLAFERGLYGLAPDLNNAAEFYQIAADKKHARALNNLAMMYAEGRGEPKDAARATELLEQSVEAGDPMAEYNLARMCEIGAGVPKNDQKAIDLYKRAAKDGHALAQCTLGHKYALGQGVARNDALAVDYYRQAAENGYPPAMRSLASFYLSGYGGLSVSREKADEWLRRAFDGQ